MDPRAPAAELVAGPLHDDVVALAFLLGTWRGEGEGGFPAMEPFRYGEELTFEHVGDPFLLYRQRSWSLDAGTPLHLELGFLRAGSPGASSSRSPIRSGSPRSPRAGSRARRSRSRAARSGARAPAARCGRSGDGTGSRATSCRTSSTWRWIGSRWPATCARR